MNTYQMLRDRLGGFLVPLIWACDHVIGIDSIDVFKVMLRPHLSEGCLLNRRVQDNQNFNDMIYQSCRQFKV